jgi:hypothetical protein
MKAIYYVLSSEGKKLFRGNPDLALAISRAFTAHGIETTLAVDAVEAEARRLRVIVREMQHTARQAYQAVMSGNWQEAGRTITKIIDAPVS